MNSINTAQRAPNTQKSDRILATCEKKKKRKKTKRKSQFLYQFFFMNFLSDNKSAELICNTMTDRIKVYSFDLSQYYHSMVKKNILFLHFKKEIKGKLIGPIQCMYSLLLLL